MDYIKNLNIADNPNELVLSDGEILEGKHDGEIITGIRLWLNNSWVPQFGMTDTVLLAFYHKVKKRCIERGLL